MAEIEIAVLKEECLNRRLPTKPGVTQEISVWEERRNRQHATVEWRFTSRNARKKLKRLYPIILQQEEEVTCQN